MGEVSSLDPSRGAVAERALLFSLGGRLFGLRLSAVDGLGESGTVSAVPGAPAAVLGLIEWRGRVLTLLDLPRLIERVAHRDAAEGNGETCIVRLAPPLERTALRVPGAVQLGWVSADPESPRAEPFHALHVQTAPQNGTESPIMIEPGELIRVLASRIES